MRKSAVAVVGKTFSSVETIPPVEVAPARLLGPPDFLDEEFLLRTLTDYPRNAFVRFLLKLFPEDRAAVWQAVKDYRIGTTRDGRTVFWQIDRNNKIRTGKIIAYDASTGKRRKDVFPNWIHAELKRQNRLKSDFNLAQCFFGEHLLIIEKEKPVAVVEAEKTAVIASVCFSEFVWLACGSKQNLNALKLHRFGKREIVLYPDADGFDRWREIAAHARLYGAMVKVSNLLENRATEEEKTNGFDLADYLISEQREINRFNLYADEYNAALQTVLRDENLISRVFALVDERADFETIRLTVFKIASGRDY